MIFGLCAFFDPYNNLNITEERKLEIKVNRFYKKGFVEVLKYTLENEYSHINFEEIKILKTEIETLRKEFEIHKKYCLGRA